MQNNLATLMVNFYMFVSIGLLVFNVGYEVSTAFRQKLKEKRAKIMKEQQYPVITKAENVNIQKHKDFVSKKIKNIYWLIAFENALQGHRKTFDESEIDDYLAEMSHTIIGTAAEYSGHPPMERAFFAYFVADNLKDNAKHFRRLCDLLILYLDGSTVYCRENVMTALCALGEKTTILKACNYMYIKGYVHNTRLMSDGFAKFNGDKAELAKYLWDNKEQVADYVKVATVQLMTNLPEDFEEEMLSLLDYQEGELCFAAVRYFQRKPSDKAKIKLMDIVSKNSETAIAAASALGAYPDEEVKTVLKTAMSSNNWYVRSNAAMSLLKIGLTDKDKEEMKNSSDRYAREMFAYAMEVDGRRAVKA